jgi:hypothetical protein
VWGTSSVNIARYDSKLAEQLPIVKLSEWNRDPKRTLVLILPLVLPAVGDTFLYIS